MLDRKSLLQVIFIAAVVVSISLIFDLGYILTMATAVELLALVLCFCLKDAPKTEIDDEIIRRYSVRAEFRKFMQEPAFHQSIYYVYKMSPDEFMAFCRAVSEMRYTADQQGLKDVADAMRRERQE